MATYNSPALMVHCSSSSDFSLVEDSRVQKYLIKWTITQPKPWMDPTHVKLLAN